MKRTSIAFIWGLLFGAGLVTAGLMHPQVIQGYLDFSGDWDPTLLITLCAAVGVYAPLFSLFKRRKKTLLGSTLELPQVRRIDARLALGSAIFGCGWGLAGMCPGANLAGLAEGGMMTFSFLAFWVTGMFAGQLLDRYRSTSARTTEVALFEVAQSRPS